jgi:hypothetical protein
MTAVKKRANQSLTKTPLVERSSDVEHNPKNFSFLSENFFDYKICQTEKVNPTN